MKKEKITSENIKLLLQEKYSQPDKHMIAFEVSDGTGSAATRWADAVSMELWPSNGYTITGYEIKVSRADWLSELKQPDKSHAISKYCDHWYLVAPDGVLGVDELPKGWGWIRATKKQIRTKIKAPKRSPEPLDHPFVASFLRKAVHKYRDRSMFDSIYEKALKDKERMLKDRHEYEIDRFKRDNESLKKTIKGFQESTGVGLSRWNYERLGEVLSGLKVGDERDETLSNLKRTLSIRENNSERIKAAIDALEAWPKESEDER